jgi:hypothetical protein
MATTQTRAASGYSLSSKRLLRYIDGEWSQDGVRTASVLYVVSAQSLLTNLPIVGTSGDSHPLFGSSWKAFRYRWRHHDKVSKSLVFLLVEFLSLDVANVQEEEADSVVGEEPITSHPEFLQASGGGAGIAGTFPNNRTVDPATGYFEGTPRDGARFDQFGQNKTKTAADYNPDVGKFLFFAPGFQLGGVSAAGMERYRVPRGTYSRAYTDTIKPNLAGVGKTVAAPVGAPGLAVGFTWLLVRKGYRRLGFLFRVNEGYEAGRWNPTIYPAL